MTTQRWFSTIGIAAVIGLLALLAWGMTRTDAVSGGMGVNSQGGIARVQPRPAPDFQLTLFNQTSAPWRLSDQRGKKVVINFWASWCDPCRTEAGTLEQAANDYKANNIIVVGVDIWDDNGAARGFVDEFRLTYPNGRDEKSVAAIDYGVTGIPETFVVDGKGMITQHWIGPVNRSALDSMVGLVVAP